MVMETKKEKNLKEEGKQKKSGKEQKIKIPNKMIVEVRKSNPFGNIFFYIFLFLMMYLIFGSTSGSAFMQEEVSISDVIKLINEEKVQDVTVVGDKVEVLKRSGTKVYARKESNISFDEILSNNQVDRSKIAGKLEVKQQVNIMDILSPILMFGLPIFIFYYFLKQMRTQGEI